MKIVNYGIDLGTTNSGIGKFSNGEVVIFKNPQNQKETIASVVGFRKDKYLVGEKAREFLQRDPENVFSHFKRKMGTSHKYFVPNQGKEVSPIELSSLILKELKTFIYNGEMPESVVITIPAAFDTVQSNATKNAGLKAGFSQVLLLQEPVAASLAYANKSGIDLASGFWVVYDLGGGTFDAALVGIINDELKVIDHEGDNYLGGADLDLLILENIVLPKFLNQHNLDIVTLEQNHSQEWNKLKIVLTLKCEEVKKELSTNDAAEIEIIFETQDGNEYISYIDVTKNEFEKMIAPQIDRTLALTKKLLDNNLQCTPVNAILLVGGSTYIPYVRQKLNEVFGIKVETSIDPITAVIVGAAYYAGTKSVAATILNENVKVTNEKQSDFEVKIAYSKVSKSEDELVLMAATGNYNNCTYRVLSNDGRYDSGIMTVTEKMKMLLPLLPNEVNTFECNFFDPQGQKLPSLKQNIIITHGKYALSGQPLPVDICIELDSPTDGRSYLDPVFTKNAILPLHKNITRQLVSTIRKNTNDFISINIFEGSHAEVPEAAKKIGKIIIKGTDLERDIIKGSDIDCEFTMSESRDLKVKVYVSMSDQEFENVFASDETDIHIPDLISDLTLLESKLSKELTKFEEEENFEAAAKMLNELNEIKKMILDLSNNVSIDTDKKFKYDIKKREIAGVLGKTIYSSLFTSLAEKYNMLKDEFTYLLNESYSIPSDKEEYEKIVKNEDNLLRDGSTKALKAKIDALKMLMTKINKRYKVTDQDIMLYFNYFKNLKYQNQTQANNYITQGEKSISEQNIMMLTQSVNNLYTLYTKENPEDKSDNFIPKTGLR